MLELADVAVLEQRVITGTAAVPVAVLLSVVLFHPYIDLLRASIAATAIAGLFQGVTLASFSILVAGLFWGMVLVYRNFQDD